MELTKEELINKCHFCDLLESKMMPINSNQIYIKCCNINQIHKIDNLENTPKGCPFYAERFIIYNN